MYQYLRKLKVSKENIVVLHHSDKRHGVNEEIEPQIEDNSLLITLDASCNTVEWATKLADRNIKICTLDHHSLIVKADNIITVNNQYSNQITNKALSGCGVTHKFLQYCDQQLHHRYSSKFVDLVALSIVSDSCDVRTYENRAYLKQGLKKIINPFYKYLCDNLIISKGLEVTPHELSFKIINILNSVQRSSNQALKDKVFRCFVGEQDNFAEVLKECQKEKRLQDDTVKKVIEEIKVDETQPIVIAFAEDVDGYSGLIANKLMSKYQKPCFVLHEHDDKYLGSCRSPIGIREELYNSGLFDTCAGHSAAFGVEFDKCLLDASNPNNLIEFLSQIQLEDSEEYKVIGSYKPSQIPSKLFDLFKDYNELWANELPEPLIHVRLEINGKDWVEMGNGSTIKIVEEDITFIKFFAAKSYKESIGVGQNKQYQVDILGTCNLNEWNGNITKQIVIDKIETKEIEMQNITWQDLF